MEVDEVINLEQILEQTEFNIKYDIIPDTIETRMYIFSTPETLSICNYMDIHAFSKHLNVLRDALFSEIRIKVNDREFKIIRSDAPSPITPYMKSHQQNQ